MHVIIQAGGKGTRLEGLTRNRPKCLVPVNNRPMIFWAFEAFKDHDITVICDYKQDALVKYLAAFGPQYRIRVVDADGKGTASGIRNAIQNFNDNDPVVVLWCDLLFHQNWSMPNIMKAPIEQNLIGLSGTFPCRWSFDNGRLKHSASSSAGVAGFFVFKNKDELADVPKEGALVPWLQSRDIQFTPFYLENIDEVGTMRVFESYSSPAVCRPFNEVIFNEDTVTKRGIDDQGRKIAVDEIAWYKHVKNLGFEAIPKIHSFEPLVMERIRGHNIFEYDCLTMSEKRKIIDGIVNGLKSLHNLEPAHPAVVSDLDDNYIDKTFKRLEKVEDLVPFAREEYIRINDRYYKNIFYDRDSLARILRNFYPQEFKLIHGDPTFSNMIYDRVNGKVYFIDPRGYFGKTKLYGDVDYDWAKVYYSLVGNYDQFNRKKFAIEIGTKGVELAVRPNNWADMEDYYFDQLDGVSKTKIRALHAVIWLSLTTYAWEDYDSICAAFYNGILKSADFL
ncbi:NTP transferase domain-containing protein [Sutterella megalosphaeroides]|uniref:MobA-like NTP transferase domain-containing protein n=1 Tax=Sutterella megalosphaeroides TaxID=2494234 RepID=A0A2Z6IAZ4_9BURK|nr:NTP transferase domain-containing protein [Sutterella megalosphaeroides]BBF23564.1 hypothetical protein SUTMEG_14550 [Sutterella megalosphaeroides]